MSCEMVPRANVCSSFGGDIYNSGAGLKPVVSHVVDLDIQIKYTPGDPARLKAEITDKVTKAELALPCESDQ